MVSEIINRISFWKGADRIGPDLPWTHWRLYFKSTMIKLCSQKFLYFGKGAEFRPGAYAITCSKISIGDNVIIRPGVMLFADPRQCEDGKIIIENNVMIGSCVHFYVANHRFDRVDTPFINQGHYPPKTIRIGQGSWIGANSTILPGVEIGSNTIIGAGSVVTKSFPLNVLVAGNPAKIIKQLDKFD